MIIRTESYPRAALIGNPSDGYFGKTIAFVFNNYKAEVLLYETPEVVIEMQERDRSAFPSVEGLFNDVKQYGYYGGIRLLKAAIKKFYEHCLKYELTLENKNFTIRYQTNIPNRLGLAGSSAIITACMKALMKFYSVDIPLPLLANLVLSVETEELRIGAGLQDRVAQAYETPVYMDFNQSVMELQGYGSYQTLSAGLLPNLYIGFRTDLSEGSEVVHNDLRSRYNRGDKEVLAAIEKWSTLTCQAKTALEQGEVGKIGALLDENFDTRRSIMKLSKANIKMVETARATGASAKFTGSGGAIIGTYEDKKMYKKLVEELGKQKIVVFKPNIISY